MLVIHLIDGILMLAMMILMYYTIKLVLTSLSSLMKPSQEESHQEKHETPGRKIRARKSKNAETIH